MFEPDRYIDKRLCFMTGVLLAEDVSLALAVARHREDGFFSRENHAKFMEIVHRIVREQPNLNVWKEEEVGKAFGCERYEDQRLILELAYYEAGRIMSEDSERVTLEDLRKWADCTMKHGFFLGYEMGKETLAGLLTSLEGRRKEMLSESRCFHWSKEALMAFCMEELTDEKTDDEVISLINIYNNGDYTELPGYISVLGLFICRNGHYDLFPGLLEHLAYFPLQGALIDMLHTVEECLCVQRQIGGSTRPKRQKVLLYLLRERIFRLMHEQPVRLEENSNNKYLTDVSVRQRVEALREVWNQHVEGYVAEAVDVWGKQFGYDELTVWLSGKQTQKAGRTLVEIINRAIYKRVSLPDLSLEDKNLETLYGYVREASEKDYAPEYYEMLIETVCRQLYTERSIRQIPLDDEGFDLLRALYRCLGKSPLDGVELMKRYRTADEGFRCDVSKAMSSYEADTVWLSMLMLQMEEVEDAGIFRSRVDVLFRYARISSFHLPLHYFLPFYIAEMVVLQVHASEKDYFEGRLIAGVSNIAFVLQVLSANEGRMSDRNKASLKSRADAEWHLEKKILKTSDKKQMSFIDEYVKAL